MGGVLKQLAAVSTFARSREKVTGKKLSAQE